MSTSDCIGRLNESSKKLLAEWYQLREVWRDDTSRQFEKQYIDVLCAEVRATIRALEHMDAILYRVRQECR